MFFISAMSKKIVSALNKEVGVGVGVDRRQPKRTRSTSGGSRLCRLPLYRHSQAHKAQCDPLQAQDDPLHLLQQVEGQFA